MGSWAGSPDGPQGSVDPSAACLARAGAGVSRLSAPPDDLALLQGPRGSDARDHPGANNDFPRSAECAPEPPGRAPWRAQSPSPG